MDRKRTQDEIDLMPTFFSCMHLYSWQECHDNLKFNFGKMKKLLGILQRTIENLKRHGTSQNIEVVEFIKTNPTLYQTLVYRVTLGQIQVGGGAFDGENVRTAMEIFTHQYKANPQLIDPIILKALNDAFITYLDPKNKKTLDHIFKQQDYKQDYKDPFTVPEDIRKYAHKLIETKGITKKRGAELMGDGSYDYWSDNFEKYKWIILNDYLFEKCILGKAPTAPIPTYRKNITKFWDKIVLPERCEYVESLVEDNRDKETIKWALHDLR